MERGVGSDGVVDFLPAAHFLVEILDAFRLLVEEMVELVVIRFVGALDKGVLLGRARVGEDVLFLDAGLVEEAEELRTVVALDVSDGERQAAADLVEEAFGGFRAGGCIGTKHPQACAGVDGGELEGFLSVGEAKVLGVHLDEGAGKGLFEGFVGAFALALKAAKALFASLGKEEVVAFEEAAEGGGREADLVALFEKDGKFVLAPSGKLAAEGDDPIDDVGRERRGAGAAGTLGAIFERGQVLGAEAVEPLVEGARGDGEVAAGKAGVLGVGAVEVEPLEAALGLAGKGVDSVETVKGAGNSRELHGVLLWETPIIGFLEGAKSTFATLSST